MYNRNGLEHRILEILKNSTPGHDPEHMKRVYELQKEINDGEGKIADDDIMHADSWLHDVGHTIYDPKDPRYEKHPQRSVEIARKILPEFNFPESKLQLTLKAIRWHDDTKPWGSHKKFNEPEILILQDADNLEALGEIGVKRIIAYCETVGIAYFAPGLSWNDPNAKFKSALHNIYAHLSLYDVLNTETARRLAVQKIKYQCAFLERELKNMNEEVPSFPYDF